VENSIGRRRCTMQEKLSERAFRFSMICDGVRCILIPLLFTTIYAASWAWLVWYVNKIGVEM
jgi:hypothetical protein